MIVTKTPSCICSLVHIYACVVSCRCNKYKKKHAEWSRPPHTELCGLPLFLGAIHVGHSSIQHTNKALQLFIMNISVYLK